MISHFNDTGSATLGAPSLMQEAQRERVRRIHADYCGWQPGLTEDTGFHLWTLLHSIEGHPAGSTVVEATLDKAIFK